MASVTCDYISVGGNRHPSAADWDRESGLIAFGADNNIAVWDPLDENSKGIGCLLRGHTDSVNAVKFITRGISKERLILSGSVDKTLRLWRQVKETTYREAFKIDAHTSSINCIDALPWSDLIISGAADGTVKVWRISTTEQDAVGLELLQEVTLKPKFFPLTVAVAPLESSEGGLVLAVGGTKPSIQIFASKSSSILRTPFELVATLTGHEAWIRSLAITRENLADESSDLIIASASQDKYIRLWRIHSGQDLPTSSKALNDPMLGMLAKSSLSNKAHRFSTAAESYSLTFEALLLGHEDWIYTASWHFRNKKLQLLTASADNSLAVWEADEASGIWMCTARLGEISAQKGSTSATGSTGGFWLGLWSPDANAVVSLGRTGAWRLWRRDTAVPDDRWIQEHAVTGHVREVNGIAWSGDGSYLLSTSNDQTTRLHSEWKSNGKRTWHEFSRPQIHGYDLNCIDTTSNKQFVSGADEKLLRVFDEPEGVADVLDRLCDISKPADVALPDAASIPVLGLSNKAGDGTVEDSTATNGDSVPAEDASSKRNATSDLQAPPLEDHLARHMLWPEREKLYGHGYEINVLAASHDGTLIATACRASSIDHAVIRLYETKEWREIKPSLKAHTLTVTGLKFSPDDKYLLSVGRDRQYCVWKRGTESDTEYSLFQNDPKAHTRMILSAGWAPPSGTKSIFVTGARDKAIKLWSVEHEEVRCMQTVPTELPVVALACLPVRLDGSIVLAFALEDGRVRLCIVKGGDEEVYFFDLKGALDQAKAATQLAWRPVRAAEGDDRNCQLAIAGADSSLHIATVTFAAQ